MSQVKLGLTSPAGEPAAPPAPTYPPKPANPEPLHPVDPEKGAVPTPEPGKSDHPAG